MKKNFLYNQDCLKGLNKFSDNTFTAQLCDPNYGIKFMNQKWDYNVPSIDIWKECLRVLKPGAYALVFGGTRTFHRLVCNIEDAGFRILDTIIWHYGSGFPKSHNVSKAIDKMAGKKRKVIGKKNYTNQNIKSNNFNRKDGINERLQLSITASATKQAKKYDGYGTALKPASELICLCQKPISEKTIAKNVLKWGTGILNINGCKIPAKPGEYDIRHYTKEDCFQNKKPKKSKFQVKPQPNGRWPANVIFDEKSAQMLDVQSGILTSGKLTGTEYEKGKVTRNCYGKFKGYTNDGRKANSGGASRFFYCAKASPSERAGSKHPTVKPLLLLKYLIMLLTLPDNNLMLDPFMGSGSTAIACEDLEIDWVGFEKEKEYCQQAKNRIQYYRRKRKHKV